MKQRIYSLALACVMLAAMLLPSIALAAPNAVESITVEPAQIGLVAGDTAKLEAKVLPSRYRNEMLSYSSSKTSVATVDEKGIVTAVKKGSATITVAAENGVKATVALKVVAKGEPTGISLNYKALELGVKSTDQLIATLAPKEGITTKNQTVSFKSSNSKVVKVDKKGNLTGVKAGTATITAKTRNGFSATCAVTVSNIKIEPTGLALSPANLSLPAGDTAQLNAEFTPTNTTEKELAYTSNNPSVASVDNKGIVTGLKEGRATITAKTANGRTARSNITVTKGAGVAVSSLRLSTNRLELAVRDTAALNVTVLPDNATDKSLTFIARDGSIASVDKNGRVTALRAGQTTIDVYSSNNITETCTVVVKDAAASASQESAGYMEDVLYYVNLEREKAGLRPLRLHGKLCDAAVIRAGEVADNLDREHKRPDGRAFQTVLSEAGISSYTTAGENIAAGPRTAKAVVEAWMKSGGHRANILNSRYSYLGVGYKTASDSYGHYWVQLFIG